MDTLPMFAQCTERESGGFQCERMLVTPDEEHHHWISQATIDAALARKDAIYTHIDLSDVWRCDQVVDPYYPL